MTSGSGRAARRRRVLSEGARSASVAADKRDDATDRPAKTRRFAPPPGSVSFAVARGLLPTRALALAGVLLAGALTTAGVLAAHVYREIIVARLGAQEAPAIDLADPGSLAHWLSVALAMACAALALVIYGLRQNRTDDVRGLYRWWLAAALALAAASIFLPARVHVTLAQSLAHATGFSPLPGDAFWWLAPGAALACVLAVRPLGDLKESKLSLACMGVSAVSFVVAVCTHLGALPRPAAPHALVVQSGALLLGLVAAVGAQLAYVRRVLLETDGVIAQPERRVAAKRGAQTPPADPPASAKKSSQRDDNEPDGPARLAVATGGKRERRAEPTQWVDGSQGDPNAYDEDAPARRKLSKAERKRLRREKARGRAA